MKKFICFEKKSILTKSRFILGIAGLLFWLISGAQSVPNFSGQYSCVENRNFSGLNEAKKGINGVASDIIFYIDFTNKKAELHGVVITGFGLTTAEHSQVTAISSNITVDKGPITNSYLITLPSQVTYVENSIVGTVGQSFSLKFHAMPVNNGNTIMLQGIADPGDSAPGTAVCNKI